MTPPWLAERDEPLRAELAGLELPPAPLPDPHRCDDPWCRHAAQGPHLHGTRPDGRRV